MARGCWRKPAQREARRLRALERVLGRFHEVSLASADIRESVEFYERLGFTHAQTTDTWGHPYGVLTDGRLIIGLHQQQALPSPTLTFVHEGIATFAAQLEAHGIELDHVRTGDERFNELGFRDPAGQHVRVLEARTYSPFTRRAQDTSLCGYFTEYSVPSADFATVKDFWEPLGFVATEEPDAPYAHLPLTSDHLDLAFHAPRILGRPLLVFRDSAMRERLARLRQLGLRESKALPPGLPIAANALIEAPEGTPLLLLEGES